MKSIFAPLFLIFTLTTPLAATASLQFSETGLKPQEVLAKACQVLEDIDFTPSYGSCESTNLWQIFPLEDRGQYLLNITGSYQDPNSLMKKNCAALFMMDKVTGFVPKVELNCRKFWGGTEKILIEYNK